MHAWIYHPDHDPLEGTRRWIADPALEELVQLFGGEWPAASGSVRRRARALAEFSGVWDGRRGGSRLDIVPTEQVQALSERVLPLVRQLGIVDPPPLRGGHYDWVLVLGGFATGCRNRTTYVSRLLASGAISTQQLCLLGSFRELHDAERTAAADFAPQAGTEVGMLHALADFEFPSRARWSIRVDGDPEAAPRQAQLVGHREGGLALNLYAARSSDPGRNANSADTYRQFANDVALSGGRLLLVSTHLYAPYQHWDAVRVLGLPRNVEVETVGTPHNPSRRDFTAACYLQEVRSALRSASALAEAVEA
jgi:hypothetical protein